MKQKKTNEKHIMIKKLKSSKLHFGLLLIAIVVFIMVLSSIANSDVGTLFQQVRMR